MEKLIGTREMKQTNKPIITPGESRLARQTIGVSQRAFAEAAGITRGYLSAWENQKHLLNDAALVKIKQAYESYGYVFSEQSKEEPVIASDVPAANSPIAKQSPAVDIAQATQVAPAAPVTPDAARDYGYRVLDGLVVMNGIDPYFIESVLEEIHENDLIIEDLMSMNAKDAFNKMIPHKGFFDGKSDVEQMAKIHMASRSELITSLLGRNYVLVKMLSGYDGIVLCSGSGEHILNEEALDNPDREKCCRGIAGVMLDMAYSRSRIKTKAASAA